MDPSPPRRRRPSHRLDLEVALLAESDPPPLPPLDVGDGASRTVLVAVGDAELRAYVHACLREHSGLRTAQPHDGEALRDALRRLAPALLIADLPALDRADASTDVPPAWPPRLVIADEPPDDAAAWAWRPGAPVVLLPLPFNARRLGAEVERMLFAT